MSPLVPWAFLMLPALGCTTLEASSHCFPAGVADSPLSIAYVAKGTGIAAIALESGKPMWKSEAASVPLIATPDRLVAAAYESVKPGYFTVALLDKSTGRLLEQSEPVAVGGASGVERPEITATIGNGQLSLTWVTRSPYRGGAAPPVQRAYTPPHETQHSVLLDLSTARILNREDSPKVAADKTAPNEAPSSVAYLRGGNWERGPWPVVGGTADFVQSGSGANLQLNLQISDASTKRVKKTRPLGKTTGAPRVTQDGFYVLVPVSDVTWHVITASSGDQVGSAIIEATARDICVHEPRLYYLANRSTPKGSEAVLQAIDLRTGRPAWELSLDQQERAKPPRLPQ